ncbi:hypothetical protein E2C01_067305 [Portunus trituberculatus]|uniref:Uncharacterized protein n=1 Tax=Portunus trituberculatus TaxID=210409 RepID=A0A5B7HT90_PORTR|nr:hypothetical protein [Portunus trituberculatus]
MPGRCRVSVDVVAANVLFVVCFPLIFLVLQPA